MRKKGDKNLNFNYFKTFKTIDDKSFWKY